MAREKNRDPKPTDAHASEPDDVKYGAAVEEIERILASIDRDEIDLDELGQKVERAVDLLKICRAKLKATEARVTDVLKDLAAEEEAAEKADDDEEPEEPAEGDSSSGSGSGDGGAAEDVSAPKPRGRRKKDEEDLPF